MAPDLSSLKVAVDVQHLYKRDAPRDQGSLYSILGGGKVTEAHCTTIYAGALVAALKGWGAEVLVNDPAHGVFVGSYPVRNAAALHWGARVYLACHLNAGRGSYALVEMMAPQPDDHLSTHIVNELIHSTPEILSGHRNLLRRNRDRGAICIEGFPALGLILEPFFGDNPVQQALLKAPRLLGIGQAIARGIASWWASKP
jgi:N-acetylmuramoyl-L-alanine amidase